MKRIVILFLSLVLLLSACGTLPPEQPPTTSSATEATQEPSAPQKASTLLDSREAFDSNGVLWYLPNEKVETMTYPTLREFCGNLLLTSTRFISDGNAELTLVLLDGADGQVLKEVSQSVAEDTGAQILGDRIAICNNVSGTVILLDSSLEEIKQYTLTPDTSAWYLGSDFDTLYKCSYTDGLRVCSASTGEERSAFALAEVSPTGFSRGTDLSLSCVDLQTQKNACVCLDLASGELLSPPFSGDFGYAYRSGEMWLACLYADPNVCYLGTDGAASVVRTQDGNLSLLDPRQHLLFSAFDGTLTLYDRSGAFLSQCALPGLYVGSLLWREELGGYLLLAIDGYNQTRMFFWDIGTGLTGDSLAAQPLEEYLYLPDGTSADASLYQRARELSSRYGLEIRIADQCGTSFPDFETYQSSDSALITAALDGLQAALSNYPEGFFRQLSYGHIEKVQIQLVGGLTATNGFGGDLNYAAFTEPDNNVYRMVVDINSRMPDTFYHEFSHIIDSRLAWDAAHRQDALFSEDEWRSLQPEGFAYSETYDTLPGGIQPEWYSYFIDDYAMTNATEDRARILEYAMGDSAAIFQNAPGLLKKLQYYCDCIRDCFDTAGWPQTTAWETPLVN